jgi:hypothetical protein
MLPILQRLSAKFKWRNLPLDQPPEATPTDAVQARQSRRRFDDLWIHPSVHWELQSPHNNNQGRRFLKVNLRDSRRQAYAAIARLGSWLMEASPSLADVGENVRSERGPPSGSHSVENHPSPDGSCQDRQSVVLRGDRTDQMVLLLDRSCDHLPVRSLFAHHYDASYIGFKKGQSSSLNQRASNDGSIGSDNINLLPALALAIYPSRVISTTTPPQQEYLLLQHECLRGSWS